MQSNPVHSPIVTRAMLGEVARRLARVRFTWALLATLVVVAVATGAITHRVAGTPLLERYGYGLPALARGEFGTLLTSVAFALYPWMLATISLVVVLFVLPYEMLHGARRAALVFFSGHIGGFVLTSLLVVWPLATLGVGWGQHLSHLRDVGASAGAFACGGALVWDVPRRLRGWAGAGLAVYLGSMLVTSHRIWDPEHAIAAAVGLGVGAVLAGRVGPLPARPGFHALRSAPRVVVAVLVMLAGAMNVLSVLAAQRTAHLISWEEDLPFAVMHGTRTFIALAGIFLILLGRGLLHGRRTAWIAALLLLAGSAGSHLVRELDIDSLVVTLPLIGLLLWRRKDFRARPDVPTLARAVRLSLVAMALLAVYIALGFLLMHEHFRPDATPALAACEAGARLVFASSGELGGSNHRARWFLDSISFVWAGVLGYSLISVLRPVLRPTVDTPRDREHAWSLLRAYGHTTTDYMTTWPGNTILLNGQRDAYVAYRLTGGVALVLGDPIGTPGGCTRAIEEFVDLAAQNGWSPAFYGATGGYLREYARHGLSALPVGEDAQIDLPGLAFRGKAWQDVRTAINRAGREGVRFAMINQATAEPGIVRQLWDISNEWLTASALPEMGFTLGRLTDPPDPEVRTSIALDAGGRVQAFATWLPVYAGCGWVIDLMRRRTGAFPGVMEFLIAETALALQAEGARFISLAAAPLARVANKTEEGTTERALRLAADRLETVYHFSSLVGFKAKFQPRWEPLYLIYPGPASLPRVAYALLRAYLPNLGRDDLLRALRPPAPEPPRQDMAAGVSSTDGRAGDPVGSAARARPDDSSGE